MRQGKKWRYGRFLSNCHLLSATYKAYKGCITYVLVFRGPIFIQSGILHIFTHVMGKVFAKEKNGVMGRF